MSDVKNNTLDKQSLILLRQLEELSRMSADNGVFVMTATGTKTGEFKGIFIPLTATIDELEVDEVASNVATTYIDTITNALEAGVYITPARGSKFTKIVTSVGSVVLLNA